MTFFRQDTYSQWNIFETGGLSDIIIILCGGSLCRCRRRGWQLTGICRRQVGNVLCLVWKFYIWLVTHIDSSRNPCKVKGVRAFNPLGHRLTTCGKCYYLEGRKVRFSEHINLEIRAPRETFDQLGCSIDQAFIFGTQLLVHNGRKAWSSRNEWWYWLVDISEPSHSARPP